VQDIKHTHARLVMPTTHVTYEDSYLLSLR
jgi:hypothetical protein